MYKSIIEFYLLSAILLCPPLLQAQSQTESNQAGEASRGLTQKQKFQEELNNATLRAYEGDRDAQFRVGVLFTNDQFSEPDFEQAVYWYKQAARQDHMLAQYNLGHQYLNGIGVLQSTELAMNWWLKAARLGHPLSQFNIGRAYYLGIGLPADLKKSKYWFEQAAANNEPKSIEILAETKWDTLTQESNEPTHDHSLASSQVKSPNSEPIKQTTAQKQAPLQVAAIDPVNVAIVQPKAIIDGPPNKAEAPTVDADSTSITLYTSPSGRSILISMVYNLSDLEIVKYAGKWTNVRHKQGFPIWVHKDFVTVNGSQATLTGDSVNARAVPLILKGSIVGKLNKGDKVTVINKTDKWYRVTSPSSFTAWVKTDELTASKDSTTSTDTKTKVSSNAAISATSTLTVNPNSWLFQQEPKKFTLQLASFDNQEGAESFEENSQFLANSNLHKFTSTANNITWTYFLYGSYPNKAKAREAQTLLKTKDAWVRNIAQIQQNRCIAWKKQLPPPPELNMYCTPPTN